MDEKTKPELRLKELRKQKKMTQVDLGNILGISQAAIANYERGERFPDEMLLIKISDVFNVSIDFLLGRGGERKKNQRRTKFGFDYQKSNLGDFVDQYMEITQKSTRLALEFVVDLYYQGYQEEQILLDLFKNAMIKAGIKWMEGTYSEAMEHQLSMMVTHGIITLKSLEEQKGIPKGHFLALPAVGENHNIGLHMLCRFLEIDGWESSFLGSSVPTLSLKTYIESHDIQLLLSSITLEEHMNSLCPTISSIKKMKSYPSIMVGGSGVKKNRGQLIKCGADYIHGSVQESINYARSLISGTMANSTRVSGF